VCVRAACACPSGVVCARVWCGVCGERGGSGVARCAWVLVCARALSCVCVVVWYGGCVRACVVWYSVCVRARVCMCVRAYGKGKKWRPVTPSRPKALGSHTSCAHLLVEMALARCSTVRVCARAPRVGIGVCARACVCTRRACGVRAVVWYDVCACVQRGDARHPRTVLQLTASTHVLSSPPVPLPRRWLDGTAGLPSTFCTSTSRADALRDAATRVGLHTRARCCR
jgi:hypothetical protein